MSDNYFTIVGALRCAANKIRDNDMSIKEALELTANEMVEAAEITDARRGSPNPVYLSKELLLNGDFDVRYQTKKPDKGVGVLANKITMRDAKLPQEIIEAYIRKEAHRDLVVITIACKDSHADGICLTEEDARTFGYHLIGLSDEID